MTSQLGTKLRITWAVAAKDISEAIRNKTILGVIASAAFLMVVYRFLPALQSDDVLPTAAIYDAGSSTLVAGLQNLTGLEVRMMASQEQMAEYLGNLDTVALGLSVPSDLDMSLLSGGQVVLDGYTIHWATESEAGHIRDFFESRLSQLAGTLIGIETAENSVFTREDSRGFAFLASVSVVLAILFLGLLVSPQLMVEERQARTLDILLVSPASPGQLVIGKALAGLFFSLAAAGVALLINSFIVVHWGLAVLTAICGSLFAVSLGLLLGSLIKVRQQIQVFTWVLFVPLVIPAFLTLISDRLPSVLSTGLQWVPTVALANAFRVSFSESATLASFAPELGIVLGYSVVILAIMAWIVRRSDRVGS
jgi:ABC-2 type transport system permease protein